MIVEAPGEPREQPRPLLHLTQQDSTGIRRDRPAAECRDHLPTTEGLPLERSCLTRCFHRTGLRVRGEVLMNTTLTHERAVLFHTRGEACGLGVEHWHVRSRPFVGRLRRPQVCRPPSGCRTSNSPRSSASRRGPTTTSQCIRRGPRWRCFCRKRSLAITRAGRRSRGCPLNWRRGTNRSAAWAFIVIDYGFLTSSTLIVTGRVAMETSVLGRSFASLALLNGT